MDLRQPFSLLIEPLGIETFEQKRGISPPLKLLIEPLGIETW